MEPDLARGLIAQRLDNWRDLMRKLGIALALVVAVELVTSTPAMAQAAKKKARQRISRFPSI